MAPLVAYESSEARGWTFQELPLQPTPLTHWATSATYPAAHGNTGSLTAERGQGSNPQSSQRQAFKLLSHNRSSGSLLIRDLNISEAEDTQNTYKCKHEWAGKLEYEQMVMSFFQQSI